MSKTTSNVLLTVYALPYISVFLNLLGAYSSIGIFSVLNYYFTSPTGATQVKRITEDICKPENCVPGKPFSEELISVINAYQFSAISVMCFIIGIFLSVILIISVNRHIKLRTERRMENIVLSFIIAAFIMIVDIAGIVTVFPMNNLLPDSIIVTSIVAGAINILALGIFIFLFFRTI